MKINYTYQLVISGIRVIRNEGWASFWFKMRSWLKQRSNRPLFVPTGDCSTENAAAIGAGVTRTPSVLDRRYIAEIYLKGAGIEIGACHVPLTIPKHVKVKYVDKFCSSELRKRYPELGSAKIVNTDIIDDGELLAKIADKSQDFVIANHFLEHCQDPIGVISNMLRVLKNGGILYMAVPDKRFTFDADRPITPIEHLIKDYGDHGMGSRRAAFEEAIRYVGKVKGDAEVESEIIRLMNRDDSIHYHAWTQVEIVELILTLKKTLGFNFEIELLYKRGNELITVLTKTG